MAKLVKGVNDFATVHPELVEEWDFDKNEFGPDEVTSGSGKFAYWNCKKCGYKWKSKILDRAHNHGCPVCSGNKVCQGINDLATTHPNIAAQWNYEKNGAISPQTVSKGCTKRVWWICEYGHEWQSSINSRTNHNSFKCPVCTGESKTSLAEQAILFYARQIDANAINRYRPEWLKPMEIDVFLPKYNVGIEYDGVVYHTNPTRDKKKNELCAKNNVKLIRIREVGAPGVELYRATIITRTDLSDSGLKDSITNAFNLMQTWFPDIPNIDVDIRRDTVKMYDQMQFTKKENSLAVLFPDVAECWDQEKNGNLTPENVHAFSSKRAWFKCKDCGYSFQSAISNRTNRCGDSVCPRCNAKNKNFKAWATRRKKKENEKNG